MNKENYKEFLWDILDHKKLTKRDQKIINEHIKEMRPLDWSAICNECELTESFMREYKDKLNWSTVSRNQKLSEDFIREFQDKLEWVFISNSYYIKNKFLKEFDNKVYWNIVNHNREMMDDLGFWERYDNEV